MKKNKTNTTTIQNKRFLFFFAVALFILLGASGSAFAQKSLNAKYPKPDFTAMEEYWEVIDYEYDFTKNGIPTFTVTAKKKERNVPRTWLVTWRDAKGVRISQYSLYFDSANQAEAGEPVSYGGNAPFKENMPRVKSVVITQHPDLP